jgi:hypothetical protein
MRHHETSDEKIFSLCNSFDVNAAAEGVCEYIGYSQFAASDSAAQLVKINYNETKGSFDVAARRDAAAKPPARGEDKPETSVGDFSGALGCGGTT